MIITTIVIVKLFFFFFEKKNPEDLFDLSFMNKGNIYIYICVYFFYNKSPLLRETRVCNWL